MQTVDEMVDEANHNGQPIGYSGPHGEWVVAGAEHRDGDAVDRSNWRVLLDRLGGESDTVAIERFTHWAVGWVNYLLIDPADTKRCGIAEDARKSLEDYPILDEDDFTELPPQGA